LAGRVTFVELGGLRLSDIGAQRLDDLWLRGGLPESLAAPTNEASNRWRCAGSWMSLQVASTTGQTLA